MNPRPVPVHVPAPRWRCAVDELVPRVVPVDGPADAVCLLDGHGPWWREVERLFAAGARGAVVVSPSTAPVDRVEALTALGGPVALCRPRLEGRTPPGPGAAPHLVVADVVAARARAATAVRDAAGWARHLAGSALVPEAVTGGGAAVVVTSTSTAGVPVTLTLAVGPAETSTALDVVAVGPARAEVRVDDATGRREVAVTDDRGTLVLPCRYEDGARSALRRVVGALAAGEAGAAGLPDLAELVADEEIAQRVVAALRP
ncbi:hypothetical protein [Kineococcus sp. SYSU DK001]|uniref:hypothetical protein n=1 Tax=Kineococcus sp. SYSU DK001 TaxID=3383122 RepID=UPI003D7E6CAF